jgi:hypothetical protein
MPRLRVSAWLSLTDTYSNIAFLLHSSEENDDMSVLVAVIHFRVGEKQQSLQPDLRHGIASPKVKITSLHIQDSWTEWLKRN